MQDAKISWPPRVIAEVRTSTPTDTLNAECYSSYTQSATTQPTIFGSRSSFMSFATPGPIPGSEIASKSSTGTKIATVASFLAGLDVALVPLAPHLVDAGIDSFNSLTALACLSVDMRRALSISLPDQIAARNPQCPSPLRLLSLSPH